MYLLPLEPPSHLPPHPTPLGCHRAPTLSSLLHTANSHWLSILYMVVCIFQCDFFNSSLLHLSPLCPQTVLYVCISIFSSVQLLSPVQLFATPWTAARRPPCPSPTPEACSNSCPLNWWWHPTTSSSVVPFSSYLQSFLASGSFPMSQFFTSGGQMIGFSASASVLPMNIQDWFPLEWTGWISLQSKGLSRVFSNINHSSKASVLWCLAFFIVQLSHLYMTTGKTIALTRQTFVCKVMSLLFNMLSRWTSV